MFEIGSSLREARLRHGLEFPEVERDTKIRSRYLRALEEERFDALPAPTYVKGFLRTYAEYLGLDGQLYVDEFNSRYIAEEEPPFRAKSTVGPRRGGRVSTNAVLVALAAIGVVFALAIIAFKFGAPEDNTAGVQTPAGKTSKQKAKRKAHKPRRARRPPPPKTANLFITATGDGSWVEVRPSVSAAPLYSGTMTAGQRLHFNKKLLYLNVGRPQNLRLELNGKARRLAGELPVRVLVTKRGIRPAPTA